MQLGSTQVVSHLKTLEVMVLTSPRPCLVCALQCLGREMCPTVLEAERLTCEMLGDGHEKGS